MLSIAVAALALASSITALPQPRALLAPADPKRFTYFPSPTPLAGPCDITKGNDGNVWTIDILTNKIAVLDIVTQKTTEYVIPYDTSSSTPVPQNLEPNQLAAACVIQSGFDGNMYFSTGFRSQLGQFNPTTKQFKIFTPPNANILSNLEPANDIAPVSDGVYFSLTTANALYFFDYATEQFARYPVATPVAGPLATFPAADGNLYMTEAIAGKVAKFNRKTRSFEYEQQLPVPAGTLCTVIRAEYPVGTIFISCAGGGAQIAFNYNTRTTRVYPDPSPASAPLENILDGDNNLWYVTGGRGTLNKLNTTTGAVTEIPVPDAVVNVGGVATAGNPVLLGLVYIKATNSLYFTEVAGNKVGRYQLD